MYKILNVLKMIQNTMAPRVLGMCGDIVFRNFPFCKKMCLLFGVSRHCLFFWEISFLKETGQWSIMTLLSPTIKDRISIFLKPMRLNTHIPKKTDQRQENRKGVPICLNSYVLILARVSLQSQRMRWEAMPAWEAVLSPRL
jgi:hypothetical protein